MIRRKKRKQRSEFLNCAQKEQFEKVQEALKETVEVWENQDNENLTEKVTKLEDACTTMLEMMGINAEEQNKLIEKMKASYFK